MSFKIIKKKQESKQLRKHKRFNVIKTITFSTKIDKNDLMLKARRGAKFLSVYGRLFLKIRSRRRPDKFASGDDVSLMCKEMVDNIKSMVKFDVIVSLKFKKFREASYMLTKS